MALNTACVIEVRTTGADTNGGGFRTGASGTDHSLQAAAQYAVTDAVTNGSTTITSATANFGTDVVGNLLYITGGTGSIAAGWYEIISRTNATTIVVDRSTGLTTGTGATLNIGGALATVGTALSLPYEPGNIIWVKGDGTYAIGTGLADNKATSTTVRTRFVGYTTTRGDGGKATLQATAAITMLTISVSGHSWENFVFDGNTATGTNGINVTSTPVRVSLSNLQVKNLSGYGITLSTASISNLIDVEVFGCGTTAGVVLATAGHYVLMERCYIHDNTVPGITVSNAGLSLSHCIVESNSGASSDGLFWNTVAPISVTHCDFHANGRDGIRHAGASAPIGGHGVITRSLFTSNGGYGINLTTGGASTLVIPQYARNAYWNNTTAARNGFAAEDGAVTLTGDPYTDAAGGNFGLNNTAGAGADCRGVSGTIPGSATVNYADLGAAQHQDAGGGSTPAPFIVME